MIRSALPLTVARSVTVIVPAGFYPVPLTAIAIRPQPRRVGHPWTVLRLLGGRRV